MRAMILAEAYRTVTITEGEVEIDLPAGQAVLRAMIRNAVAGSRIAQWRFTQIVQEAERQTKADQLVPYTRSNGRGWCGSRSRRRRARSSRTRGRGGWWCGRAGRDRIGRQRRRKGFPVNEEREKRLAALDAAIMRGAVDADLGRTIDVAIAATMLDARYVGMHRRKQRRR